MTTDIRDLALLADGRTAALVTPGGDVCWLCWPRIDSDPLLCSILDPSAGGELSLRPVGGTLFERGYVPGSLVLRTRWRCSGGEVVLDDALGIEGLHPRLLRTVGDVRGEVDLVCRVRPAFTALRIAGTRLWCKPAGGPPVAVDAPSVWRLQRDGAAEVRFRAEPGAAVTLHALAEQAVDARTSLERTLRDWRMLRARLRLHVPEGGVAARAVGDRVAHELLLRSACVLAGLRRRAGGGIVAAPTTSLPQWPGTGRTWDYRYAWLRDTALAGLAMLRLGMVEEAHALGTFCADACGGDEPRVLLRVDGGAPPEEHEDARLRGYRDSRPVRIGNAAAEQVQLDVTGEVVQFARALHGVGALPDGLRTATARLADIAAERWRRPDHGIWEIRGGTRAYTHSRLLAWVALRDAAALHDAGVVSGDAPRWRGEAAAIEAALGRDHVGAHGFTMHDGGGGADASLSLVVLEGLLPGSDPRVQATLDSVCGLARNGLVDRYEGQPDALDDACAPFLFPTFWLAQALEDCGRDGAETMRAACAARSAVDLWSEVADPETRTPLGNYPQVQSHAGYVLCATARRGQGFRV